MTIYEQTDAWIDAHFDEQVRFLQELIRVPTDTPPGNNAPHAARTAALLHDMGIEAEQHLESVTNLVVRRKYGPGRTVLLNAHGDVVPPGDGWTKDPYAGVVESGRVYGRAAAVSKCDFSTYTFATRALEAVAKPAKGSVPRAKQELTRWLNLPTRYYIHTLKLEPGKFETLRITREVVLPPAL